VLIRIDRVGSLSLSLIVEENVLGKDGNEDAGCKGDPIDRAKRYPWARREG
jgi:hypothetical protein